MDIPSKAPDEQPDEDQLAFTEALLKSQDGDETLVECGSGKVLSGLARRIDKDLTGLALNTPADIEAFLKTA